MYTIMAKSFKLSVCVSCISMHNIIYELYMLGVLNFINEFLWIYNLPVFCLCLFELPSFQKLRPLGKKVEMKLCKQDISNSMTIELENSVYGMMSKSLFHQANMSM